VTFINLFSKQLGFSAPNPLVIDREEQHYGINSSYIS